MSAADEIREKKGPFPRIYKFDHAADKLKAFEERKCLICRNEFTNGSHKAVRLPCCHRDSEELEKDHFVGQSCLKERFQSKNNCPYCKRVFSGPQMAYLIGIGKKSYTPETCHKCHEYEHIHDKEACKAGKMASCPDCGSNWALHDKRDCDDMKADKAAKDRHYVNCTFCRYTRDKKPRSQIERHSCKNPDDPGSLLYHPPQSVVSSRCTQSFDSSRCTQSFDSSRCAQSYESSCAPSAQSYKSSCAPSAQAFPSGSDFSGRASSGSDGSYLSNQPSNKPSMESHRVRRESSTGRGRRDSTSRRPTHGRR